MRGENIQENAYEKKNITRQIIFGHITQGNNLGTLIINQINQYINCNEMKPHSEMITRF